MFLLFKNNNNISRMSATFTCIAFSSQCHIAPFVYAGGYININCNFVRNSTVAHTFFTRSINNFTFTVTITARLNIDKLPEN